MPVISVPCDFLRRDGRVCAVNCRSGRCPAHTGRQTHIMCEGCHARGTRSATGMCQRCCFGSAAGRLLNVKRLIAESEARMAAAAAAAAE